MKIIIELVDDNSAEVKMESGQIPTIEQVDTIELAMNSYLDRLHSVVLEQKIEDIVLGTFKSKMEKVPEEK